MIQQQQKKKMMNALLGAVAKGELEVVEAMMVAAEDQDVSVFDDNNNTNNTTFGRARLSPLHVAAANGRIQVRDWWLLVDLIDRFSLFCKRRSRGV